jgi:hypothetical protein
VGVVIGFAPSAWRYIRGPYNLIDSYRAGLFFVGLLWAMGLGRLVFFPQAEDARRAVIALSCALAAYLVVLARQGALR